MCDDERILGSGDFVERVIREAEARMQRQYTAGERGQRIERLIAEECKKRKVSLTELRSRRGVIPAFRGHVSRKLVEDYGIPIAEVARQVGVSTFAISKSLQRSSSWSKTSPF
jgi:putative transposase